MCYLALDGATRDAAKLVLARSHHVEVGPAAGKEYFDTD
jgi:hypothetical protein